MDRQCKKKQQTIYIWTDSAKKTALEHLQCSRQCKKNNSIYIWTDSAKNNKQFTYGQTVQKNNSNLHMDRQCKKQTKKNNKNTSNLHMDSTYLQTVQKTMCKIQIHILSTLSVL